MTKDFKNDLENEAADRHEQNGVCLFESGGAWAWDYRQKEIDQLKEGYFFESKIANKLRRGNQQLREAIEKMLNECNMAAQGHWDATDKVKQIAFEALTVGENCETM